MYRKILFALLATLGLLAGLVGDALAVSQSKTVCNSFKVGGVLKAKQCVKVTFDWLDGSGIVACSSAQPFYYIYDTAYSWENKSTFCQGVYGNYKEGGAQADLYRSGALYSGSNVWCGAWSRTPPPGPIACYAIP